MADLSGYYPMTVQPYTINLTTNTPAQTTTSFSGKTFRTAFGAQYYEAELKYNTLKQSEFRAINAFIGQAFGPTFSFEIVMPEISYTTLANQTGSTPSTTASYAKGVKQVSIDGCGANGKVLGAGDYFKFANHSKVYQAAADCTANSSGVATLFFAGSLVEAVPNNTSLTITAVPFTMILQENNSGFQTGVGGLVGGFSIKMREVF